MGIDPNNLPDAFKKCMPVSERKNVLPDPLTFEEADSKREEMSEKEMHRIFGQWLNLHEILYLEARMDKAATIPEGWPDFSIFYNGQSLFIEMKTHDGVLSDAQMCKGTLIVNAGCKFRVCRSVKSAIKIVKEVFGV